MGSGCSVSVARSVLSTDVVFFTINKTLPQDVYTGTTVEWKGCTHLVLDTKKLYAHAKQTNDFLGVIYAQETLGVIYHIYEFRKRAQLIDYLNHIDLDSGGFDA
jgi:hypothetical protein